MCFFKALIYFSLLSLSKLETLIMFFPKIDSSLFINSSEGFCKSILLITAIKGIFFLLLSELYFLHNQSIYQALKLINKYQFF